MKKLLFPILIFILAACASQPTPTKPPATNVPEVTEIPTEVPIETEIQGKQTEEVAMSFEISSPAFGNGDAIPVDFSCDGDDKSPALNWTEPPAGTQSFALSWMIPMRRWEPGCIGSCITFQLQLVN